MAKLLILFRPATGEVRAKGVTDRKMLVPSPAALTDRSIHII
jgi:hypothetical protein